MRWFRIPLLHFLVGGAALFWLVHRAMPGTPGAASTAPIVITSDDVAQMRSDYTRETGLQPTAADEAALVGKAVEEELLLREAVARGLDRNDRSVRSWLVEQMRILADDTTSDEDDLYARARALELDRKDLVVRRILLQKMRLLASRAGEQEVTDDELRAFYAQHQSEYELPERVSLWQVFFGSHRQGGEAQQQAERLLAALRSGPADMTSTARRGDPFPLPAHLIAQSRQQLAKLFGPGFADQIMRGEPRTWIGPLPSPYGVHLVWIDNRERGAPPSFESVRGRVLESWHEARRAERLAQLIRGLATRYPLRIESTAWRERRGA